MTVWCKIWGGKNLRRTKIQADTIILWGVYLLGHSQAICAWKDFQVENRLFIYLYRPLFPSLKWMGTALYKSAVKHWREAKVSLLKYIDLFNFQYMHCPLNIGDGNIKEIGNGILFLLSVKLSLSLLNSFKIHFPHQNKAAISSSFIISCFALFYVAKSFDFCLFCAEY